LQNDSPIFHLSLRYCGITSLGAKYLGESLGSATHQNTRLLSLDLAGNHICDAGASHLADGLRLNRTLLVLNLAGNAIGDAGATRLAMVLSSFELTHEEVVQRRRLHHEQRRRTASRQLSGTKLTASQRTLSSASGSHQRGRKRGGASPAERTDHGKSLKPTAGKAGKTARQSALEDGKPKKDKTGTKSKRSAQLGRGISKSESSTAADQPLASDSRTHPLLSAVVLRTSTVARPTTLVRGNRSLISLNLARNEIGHAGLAALLDAVLPFSRYPVSADPAMPGLLRLLVHSNRDPRTGTTSGLSRTSRATAGSTETGRAGGEADVTVRYLSAVMASRDPLLRHHTPSSSSKTHINVVDG